MIGDQLPRDRVDLFPDPDLRRAARDIHGAMRTALPFRQSIKGRIPFLGAQEPLVAHRDADELAYVGIAGIVFVLHGSPFARKIHLRKCRSANNHHCKSCKKQRNGKLSATDQTHGKPPTEDADFSENVSEAVWNSIPRRSACPPWAVWDRLRQAHVSI